jgi:hypothetical protein
MSDLNALAQSRYAAGEYTRKPLSYLLEYERILTHARDREVRILELGVSSGASLLMWKDYLPHGMIVGSISTPCPQQLPARIASISFAPVRMIPRLWIRLLQSPAARSI